MKLITLTLFLSLHQFFPFSQKSDEYEVYAVKYLDAGKHPASDAAIGGKETDSIHSYFMVWLLKGSNNKYILVDAGYNDTSKVASPKYTRPDLVLKRLNISTDEISDIIITHAHWDHIGGITLFPKAKIWMNKEEYRYLTGEVWQEGAKTRGFKKQDARNILEANLQGRLKLVEGDDVEIMPGIRAYIHSKHSFENMALVVNSNSEKNKILLASDAIWFYYNLDHLLSNTLVIDSAAFVKNLKRLKTLVPNPKLIIPGHDALIFSRFPEVAEGIVKIEE